MAKYSTTTAAGFIEYHEARGRIIPGTWDDTGIEAALLLASEWIDNIYGNSFIGQKTSGFLQDREWPRINAVIDDPRYAYVFDDTVIPDRVTNAVYEAAWRQMSTPGSLSIDYKPNKYTSVSISGAVSVDYAMFASASEIQGSFPIIDQLLSVLMCESSNFSSYSGRLERV